MIIIPINTEFETKIVVLIEPCNLERMREADPITINSIQQGGTVDIHHPHNCSIMIAYEEDPAPIYEMAKRNDLMGIMLHLTRGYKFVDGLDGDHLAVNVGGKG